MRPKDDDRQDVLPGGYDRPFGSSGVVAVAAPGRPAPGVGAVVATAAAVNVNVLVQRQNRGLESRVWMRMSYWSVDLTLEREIRISRLGLIALRVEVVWWNVNQWQ